MKNLFKKDHSGSSLIAYAALGAIAAGAITYLYLKRKASLKFIEQQTTAHAGDYLKRGHSKKRRTTDVHDLGKIVGKNL